MSVTYTVRCIKDLEHHFDDGSGWCVRCGKYRADGRRIGRREDRSPVTAVDITEPRHPHPEADRD